MPTNVIKIFDHAGKTPSCSELKSPWAAGANDLRKTCRLAELS
jgi:hypothetical protein